jgi:hypothetical protein
MPRPIYLLASVLLACPLWAQDAYMGVALTYATPQGAFANSSFPANPSSGYLAILPGTGFFPTVLMGTPATTQGYNAGVGLQVTRSVPVDRTWAIRADASMFTFSGSATAPNYPSVGLKAGLATIGCDALAFLGDGNAFQYQGTYLFGGLSLDIGMYNSAYMDSWDTGTSTRLGATVGIGHSFKVSDYRRYSLEAAYHTTLSGTGTTDPPSSDLISISVGMIF